VVLSTEGAEQSIQSPGSQKCVHIKSQRQLTSKLSIY